MATLSGLQIKQRITDVLIRDWPTVGAETPFYPENRDVSSIYLFLYSYVGNKLNIAIELSPIVIEISDGFSLAI